MTRTVRVNGTVRAPPLPAPRPDRKQLSQAVRMFKLIILAVGLAVGFGGGVYYTINNPKEAADLNVKQQEWLKKGQEQALTKLKEVLAAKVQAAESSPAAAPGKGFASGFAGGTPAKSEAETLKTVQATVDAQLSQLK
jgi:hypothetical protein